MARACSWRAKSGGVCFFIVFVCLLAYYCFASLSFDDAPPTTTTADVLLEKDKSKGARRAPSESNPSHRALPQSLSSLRPAFPDPQSSVFCPTTDFRNLTIIVGMGGSGTRGVQLLASMVAWFGVTDAEGDVIGCVVRDDSKAFSVMRRVDYDVAKLPHDFFMSMLAAWQEQLLSPQCIGMVPSGSCVWGWKSPRKFLYIPILAALFPHLRVVHVVRDGRDMAFSTNTRQMSSFSRFLLNATQRRAASSDAERQMIYWSKMNADLFDSARARLGDRYLLVRVEDLVTDNRAARLAEMERVIRFVLGRSKLEADLLQQLPGWAHIFDVSIAAAHNDGAGSSSTYGRWRAHPREEILALERIGQRGLRQFGYLNESDER